MKSWDSGLGDGTSLTDKGKESAAGFSVPFFSVILNSWRLPANRVDRSKVGLQSLVELPSHFGVTSIVGMDGIAHQLRIPHDSIEDIGDEDRSCFFAELLVALAKTSAPNWQVDTADDHQCSSGLDGFNDAFQVLEGSSFGDTVLQIISAQSDQNNSGRLG